MKLIIFDLDQTLVNSISFHDEAFRYIFRRYFDVEAHLTEVDFAGKSLQQNFADLARLKGIAEALIKEKIRAFLPGYDLVFSSCIPPDARQYVNPGVIPLLETLAKTDNLIMLYTGDSPAVVESTFAATGLGKYFKYAFYGTETASRAEMVSRAVRKAEELAGEKFTGNNVVIIGDSTRDIESGKVFGARTIAVATGFHSASQLQVLKPDYLFNNLADSNSVIKAIMD